jgi:phosphonate metabolism-associated iron-containing alcohol dehydrogenase
LNNNKRYYHCTPSFNWTFYNPVELSIGSGSRAKLLKKIPEKLLIISTARGRKQIINDQILSALNNRKGVVWFDSVVENPSEDFLQATIDELKEYKCHAILAFGGGSVIDAAKIIKLSLNDGHKGSSIDLLMEKDHDVSTTNSLPLYVIPTTAGTGSEVTPFATIWDKKNNVKKSISSKLMFANAAFVDADLTESLPNSVVISSGLDAINQAAESIWNINSNDITFGYAARAIDLGLYALPRLAKGINDIKEREMMAEASLLAGLAISHTKTSICHSISYALTLNFDVPHGLACAFTMPSVLSWNLQAKDDGRFASLANLITGTPDKSQLIAIFENLNNSVDVRGKVKKYIPNLSSLKKLQSQMYTVGRADNNYANIAMKRLEKILEDAWGYDE